MGSYPCIPTNDKDAKMSWPHYSDPTWDKEQTVFGKAEPGLFYNYSDRLYSSDATAAAEAAGKAPNTAAYWQVFLEAFHGKPVELKHILAGTNRSNGYPYWVFGYRY